MGGLCRSTVPPTSTPAPTSYYQHPPHQMMPTMSEASALFANVYADIPNNGGRFVEMNHTTIREGVQGVNGREGLTPVNVGTLTVQQLQLILQGAHEKALRAVEPMVQELMDRITGLEANMALLEALRMRMDATLSDHEQRRDKRQCAGADRQAFEEESEVRCALTAVVFAAVGVVACVGISISPDASV
jgi:hypothetical protein